MRIYLSESFQRDLAILSVEQRAKVLVTMIELPNTFKQPHAHSGLGIRKIHQSGIYEARVDLDTRIAFGLESNTVILNRVGNHDDIRRYLKSL